MNEISHAIETLATMRQTKGCRNETRIELWISKVSFWLYITSGSMLAALASFVMFSAFFETPRTVGVFFSYVESASIGLAIFAFIFSTASLILFVANSLTQEASIRAQEHDHDLANVAELILFEERVLSCALKWLEIQIDRIQHRTVYLIGGSDKLSLLAIVGLSWTVWTSFPLKNALWNEKPFVFGMAFLAGVMMGGVLKNLILGRYRYQKEILQLALEYQKHKIPLMRHHVFPPVPFKIKMANIYGDFMSCLLVK